MRRLAPLFGLCLIALGLSGCFGSDATGRYVAQFTNGVYRLQLVQAPDGHLSGQLDMVVLNPSGKPDYSSFVATGVSEGGSISLTFKQSAFLSMTLAGTGSLSGDRISLTGDVNPGTLSTVVFVRGDDAQYQADVNALVRQANNLAAAKASAAALKKENAQRHDFAESVEQLAGRMGQFDAAADVHIARWPRAEESYRTITGKMTSYLNKERSLAGNNSADVARSQISVAIGQGPIASEQLHNDAMAVQNDFQSNIAPLLKIAEAALTKCGAVAAVPENAGIKMACGKLLAQIQPFREKYQAFGQGLAQLENVYRGERRKQEELVQLSERLE